jgi:hypothetical protein
MTLLPSGDFGIRGHPGNAYDVPATCSHPNCPRMAAHTHHCWPRSYLRGQPYEWVKLPDGGVIGNRLGFCVEHHDMLTGEIGGYRARLIWEDGVLWWEDRSVSLQSSGGGGGEPIWVRWGPTRHQPPAAGEDVGHENLPEGEQCPTCGHVKRSDRTKPKPGKLRPTKEWTVAVPDDAEVGAQILDEWIEDFAIILEATEWSSRLKRYHVLAVVLGWAIMHREEFIADVAEAAERRLSA